MFFCGGDRSYVRDFVFVRALGNCRTFHISLLSLAVQDKLIPEFREAFMVFFFLYL